MCARLRLPDVQYRGLGMPGMALTSREHSLSQVVVLLDKTAALRTMYIASPRLRRRNVTSWVQESSRKYSRFPHSPSQIKSGRSTTFRPGREHARSKQERPKEIVHRVVVAFRVASPKITLIRRRFDHYFSLAKSKWRIHFVQLYRILNSRCAQTPSAL